MNWKERREARLQRKRLGLTIGSLLAVVKDLKSRNELVGDNEADAAIIMESFIVNNSTIFKAEIDSYGIDFDLILEWIEKLLPILLALLTLL